jgi:pimeloyl-ACP methyl ester carboxylesterase
VNIRGEWIEVEGLRIHCLMAGQTDAPVLLLHGGGYDSACRSYKQSFGPIPQYHTVFAPDWPGYGESDKPNTINTTEFPIRQLRHVDQARVRRLSSL